MQPKKYKGKRIALLTWLAALIVLWLCLLGFSAQAQYQTESSWAHCQEYTGMETGYYWLCPSGVYTRFAGYYVDFMLTDDAINLVFLFEDSGIYYCHEPFPTTDLWANFALFGDDGECYYDSSPICDPSPAGNFIVSGGSYNDPYMVTFIRGNANVDLPSQGYRAYFFLATSNSSPICGETCFSIIFTGLLGLSVEEIRLQNIMTSESFDVLGRLIMNQSNK